MSRLPLGVLNAVGLILLGACSHVGAATREWGAITRPVAGPGRLNAAIDMLNRGEDGPARAQLRELLEDEPGHHTARRLLNQLDANPGTLIGQPTRTYTVRRGDTMSGLAQRFLGDPLLFYALARYNGIRVPSALAEGQVIRVPQALEREGPSRVSAPRGSVVAPASAAVAFDPVRANQLRLAGLERLNAGSVESAVALLREAHQRDPNNPAIASDYQRAQRMQSTLRSRAD